MMDGAHTAIDVNRASPHRAPQLQHRCAHAVLVGLTAGVELDSTTAIAVAGVEAFGVEARGVALPTAAACRTSTCGVVYEAPIQKHTGDCVMCEKLLGQTLSSLYHHTIAGETEA